MKSSFAFVFCYMLSHVSWANGGPGKVRGINPIRISTTEATWIAIDPIASQKLGLHHFVDCGVWQHANTFQDHVHIFQLSSAFQMDGLGTAPLDVVHNDLHQSICRRKEVDVTDAKTCSLSYRSICPWGIATDGMHIPWIIITLAECVSSVFKQRLVVPRLCKFANETTNVINIVPARFKACTPLVEDSSSALP